MKPPASVSLIVAFEVSPEDDEPFIAGWERARDSLASKDGFTTTALHRALRADADLRFVNVARIGSPEAWQQAIGDLDLPGGGMPFKAYASLYEVLHEDGTPDGAGGTVLINPFEVPTGEDEHFLTGWSHARDMFAAQRGYLGTRLHRSLAPADFRFVNIARWSSPLMFARALQLPEFEETAAAMPFRSHPALYQVVRS